MRKIICKKCGTEIDAALGECPNCGAVYYILPEEDKKLEWAMSTEPDPDGTQVFGKAAPAPDSRTLTGADDDELFSTRVWRQSEQAEVRQAQPAAPVSRPVQPRPVHRAPAAPEPGGGDDGKLRRKQLAVAAVALVAVLTLVLSVMGGLFDFSHGGTDSQVMQNLLGFTEATARNILEEGMGLEVVTMTEESEEPVGTVIRQSIREGAKVRKGDTVTITVSTGKSGEDAGSATDYAEVPGLTGKTYDEAKALLTQLGLQITKAEDAYSDKDVGQIVSQSPMKGAKLQKGDLVMVTISKGAEPSPSPEAHTITVTAGKGGSISPRGAVSVADGEDQSFTITPEDGYEIREVKVDGTDIGPVTNYTFNGVGGDHTLYVVFRQKTDVSPSPSPTPPEGEAAQAGTP